MRRRHYVFRRLKRQAKRLEEWRVFLSYIQFYWSMNHVEDEIFRRHMRYYTTIICIQMTANMIRFIKKQTRILLLYFNFHEIEYRDRYKSVSEIALCIFLYFLSYFEKQWQAILFFERSFSFIFNVYYDVIKHLMNRYKQMLFWHFYFTYERLEKYAYAISELTNRESFVWNFIDDTFRDFAKFEANQKIHFSNYKWKHEMHFQEVVDFDDLIWSLYDSTLDKQNDWNIYEKSDLLDVIREIMNEQNFLLYLYEDSAYNEHFDIMNSYSNSTNEKFEFNKIMSSMRIAIEHSFDIIKNLWIVHAFEKFMKLDFQFVVVYYMMTILLINCFICIRANQISKRFVIKFSILHKYLNECEYLKKNLKEKSENN